MPADGLGTATTTLRATESHHDPESHGSHHGSPRSACSMLACRWQQIINTVILRMIGWRGKLENTGHEGEREGRN